MINWINFLHIYQPPWQHPHVLQQVNQDAYWNLIDLFKQYPNFRATVNISGSLIELWQQQGNDDLIHAWRELFDTGQIELVASAFYHPILPLVSQQQIHRQIKMHLDLLAELFPQAKPVGFYPPEMAYHPDIESILKDYNFKWLVVDQAALPTGDEDLVVKTQHGLNAILRNRRISKSYPPEEIFKLLESGKDQIVSTGTDGEMYGHWHDDWQKHLKQILDSGNVKVWTVSDYIDSIQNINQVKLRPCSWETQQVHFENSHVYPYWQDKGNQIHKYMWQLADIATQAVEEHVDDENMQWAQYHLDRGLSSCAWWWASAKQPSAFSPLTWNPDEVEKGVEHLIRAVRSLNALDAKTKIKAEKTVSKIRNYLWTKHWSKYAQQIDKAY